MNSASLPYETKSSLRGLPRLLYVGDVPVEATYHGSALVYRLLANYPKESLYIVEGSLYRSRAERRIGGVTYRRLHVGRERLLRTRFAAWYSTFLALTAESRSKNVRSLLGSFAPEAILTVTHGYTWITAAKFAADKGLPLHVICHDDWVRLTNVAQPLKRRSRVQFGDIYRRAASRLCVSPYMAEAYQRRFGVPGTVLYPSRGIDSPAYKEPPSRLGQSNENLTVAFAGTVNSESVRNSLRLLASALDKILGRLLIFGPLTQEDAHRSQLDAHNIRLRGLIESRDLIHRFREEADVLFVPMSFDQKDETTVKISFPSKLADYTAGGLPLLIHGPAYSSAVRWARENEGVAEVVTEESEEMLTAALGRLTDVGYRWSLGARALDVGERFFSYGAAESVFLNSLTDHRVG